VTDTSMRPAHATASRWERHSSLQTFAELLLGLSFTAAVALGGYAAVTGRMTVLSQGAGVVFLVTLTCVLVSWFRAVEREEAPASAPAASVVDPISAIDAEYRR